MTTIAVIGGTGMNQWPGLKIEKQKTFDTPYGPASAPLVFGTVAGVSCVFLARHGEGHKLPPHKINYRANLWALRKLGVTSVVAICTSGGLADRFGPGTIVCPDQIIDYTWGREHTLSDGAITIEDSSSPSDTARECDMLVITTKAFDIAAALAPFIGTTPTPRAVLSLHNGIGASEAIREAMGTDVPVYASAMMIGLERQGLTHVVIKAASSPINTGSLLGDSILHLEAFVAASQKGFLPICVDPSMRETVLYKLLLNT